MRLPGCFWAGPWRQGPTALVLACGLALGPAWLPGLGSLPASAQNLEDAPDEGPLARIRPLDFGIGSAVTLASYRESFPTGGLNLSVDTLPYLEGFWSTPLTGLRPVPGMYGAWTSDWTLNMAGAYAAYAFRDQSLPISVHLRRDIRASASVGRRFDRNFAEMEARAGYAGRFEVGSHSVAPADPAYPFAALRSFHGPLVGGNAYVPIVRIPGLPWALDVGLRGDVELRPVVLTSIDANLRQLPLCVGAGGELALELRFASAAFALGFRGQALKGEGYDDMTYGPFLVLR